MTYNRMIAAVMVMIVLAAGAGAAFCGAVIDGGVDAVGSLDLGSILLNDGDSGDSGNDDDAADIDNDAAVVQTWTSGDCTCTLYDDGLFSVTGSGQMQDYTSNDPDDPDYDPNAQAPWQDYRAQIQTVYFRLTGNLHIGSYTFANCNSLESVNYQRQWGTPQVDIGSSAFRNCTSLTDINLIRYGVVTDIDTYAFGDCTSLTSVTIGYSVAAIDSFAFKGCTSLTSIIFTSQTWDITLGYSAFSLGSSAHPVTCTVMSPDNVADGRLDAYQGSYTTFDYVSTSVTVTLTAGTGGSVSPTSLTVPYGSSVSTSGNVLTVGSSTATATPSQDYSFSAWAGIPASGKITEDCTITAQFVHGVSWQSGDCTVALDMDTYAMTVSGRGPMQDYSSSDSSDPDYDPDALAPWTSYKSQIASLTIDDGVTRIGNYTFNDCTQITFAGIPNSATAIGLGGFRNCTSLASASFGSGLTVIGAQAFRETALVSVSLPDSVTAVHQYVFYGCTSLTSVTFGANVASIGNHAFDGCSVLTSFSFPSALTAIGEYTLKDCTSLASVTIPNGITAIGQYAMYGCTALTSVTIPASVTSIANSVFRGCTSLTSIYYDGLAWGITDIGTGAFSLGVSGTPVSCTVYSPLNCADQKLEAYKGSYTTFTYSSHGWYMLTFRSDDEDYGTVSVPKYAIRENEQITVDGNVIKHNGIAIVTASPSDPTEDHYYAFDSWSIQGTVTVTSDMTITAGFVRASVVRMPVLLQEYVDLDATPSYQGGEQKLDAPPWLSLDGTHLKGQVPAAGDREWTALVYWAKESVPRQDWSAYYFVLTAVANKEIELQAGVTQDVGADGTMAVLGHGDLTEDMCALLTPYRDMVTVADIRGLTSVRAMPGITNLFTLVLGDTVTSYRDQSDNHFGAVAIGAGMQSFNVPGFTAYDKDGKQITGRELQGRVLNEERARQYIEVGVISASNHYDNSTVYAVKGSTMANSENDRIVFSIAEDAPALPDYIRTMLQGASASWNVNITTAFKNLQVGQDGILHGVQADKPGTYTGTQKASLTSSEWGQMYSCTVMQSLAFTAHIAEKLEVTSS